MDAKIYLTGEGTCLSVTNILLWVKMRTSLLSKLMFFFFISFKLSVTGDKLYCPYFVASDFQNQIEVKLYRFNLWFVSQDQICGWNEFQIFRSVPVTIFQRNREVDFCTLRPELWNNLPLDLIQAVTTTQAFKSPLKSQWSALVFTWSHSLRP